MKKTFGVPLLAAAVALLTAASASAKDYYVQQVPSTLSSLAPSLSSADTIYVNQNGTLYVDVSATVGKIVIGDTTTAGQVLFSSATPQTLTVTGDVQFGANSGNVLSLSSGTVAQYLYVGGGFLASGAGTFNAGLGTVVYNGSSAQTVTAKIGTAVIQYKNLTLAGSGLKTLGSGASVNVQGKLSVQGAATTAGAFAVTYGPLASLEYNGTAPQTTSQAEWPSTMSTPITILNPNGAVSLDGNKTLTTSGLLTIVPGAILNNNGNNLTVQGNLVNNGTQSGAGNVILAGSSSQQLTGTGHYANVTLTNPAGAVADPTTGLHVDGRLTLVSGRLTLTGSNSALLLTYNGIDQPGNTSYGSSASGANTQIDTFFAGSGKLTLQAKPTATFSVANAPAITYGDSSIIISGTVNGGANGNVAVNGESVTVSIQVGATQLIQTTQTTSGNGSFSVTFSTGTIPVGNYTVNFAYGGGINLGPINIATYTQTLAVSPKTITVTPVNVSKVYGTADPSPLPYTYAPALVGGDAFTGALTRDLAGAGKPNGGEEVNNYNILLGSLSLGANYNIIFVTGQTLSITPMTVRVTANSKAKVYGDSDPAFDFTLNPAQLPFASDGTSGSLTRDSGENVGTYTIKQGSLTLGPDYSIVYTPANLTINKKSETIAVDNASLNKFYGSSDPAFTPVFTPGLVSGDAASGALARAPGETVGTYALNRGTLVIKNGDTDVTGNYNLTLQPLSMSINPVAVTVSASSPTITYGAAIPNLVKYVGLVTGSTNVSDQTTTTTPATWGNWSPSVPTQGSMPGTYTYTVNQNAADPNYTINYGTLSGTLTIKKATLTIAANNQTKAADGAVFPPSSFTASYSFAVASDTPANTFTGGTLTWSGDATTATAAGVWKISLNTSTLTSDKYDTINYVDGSLTITKGISSSDVAGDQTWGPGGSYSWEIDQANNGKAGADPGWTMLNLTNGVLNITATANNKFTINLTTLTLGTAKAGAMAKFDPTRPYAWKIVQTTGGITGFDPSLFAFNYSGVGLFANLIYGGTFGIQQNGNELDLTFTPTPQGTMDVATVLPAVKTSDVDVLYLQPSSTNITPQQSVTIAVNVANLHEAVVGAQAYLAFSSADFIADPSNANGPKVVAGGGVWDQLLTTMATTSGKLDTVIGLDLNVPAGTTADGTVALVTLTPTKSNTGASRVVFRSDSDVIGVSGGTKLTAVGGASVLPARVATPDIMIAVDNNAPVIDSIAASQVQYGVAQNVMDGPSSASDSVYSTNTVRGTVNISVAAHDLPGVGIAGAPTITLSGPGGATATPTVAGSPAGGDGTYTYTWGVDGNTANGTWTATVSVSDLAGHGPTTKTFKLGVNVNQVTGVVEMDSFKGASRTNTFSAGDGANILKTWPLPVTVGGTAFLPAGNFRDLPSFANKVLAAATTDAMSTQLRYGSIASEPTLVSQLLYGTRAMDSYMRDLIFGYIADMNSLNAIVAKLRVPNRSVDFYVYSLLSSSTKAALNNYPADPVANPPTSAQVSAVETGILNDYNNIVLGPNIYDPLRFASVTLAADTTAQLALVQGMNPAPAPGNADLVLLNRYLLRDAYIGYVIGQLNAATAQALVNYGGGVDANLVNLLLKDFDTLTQVPQSLYTEQRFLGIPLRQQTENAILAAPAPGSTAMIQLNRWLLEDAYATSLNVLNYASGLLTAQTAVDMNTFLGTPNKANQAVLEADLVTDLNNAMSLGITRSALEAAYPTQITKAATLGTFTLINVPASTTLVSAKSAWTLRETLPVSLVGTTSATANFVNSGNVPTRSGTFDVVNDHDLRGGDINGDNVVDLTDFGILQGAYGGTGSAADINGDGAVNAADYFILKANYGSQGDADVNVGP